MTSPAEDVEVVAARRPQPRRGVSFRDAGPPIALVVIFAVFAVLSSDFRTLANVQNIMDTAAVLAVVTCGITFVLMMGSIDLSAPGVMGAAAITVALLVANNRNDNDLGLLGVAVAVLLAAVLGCLSGLALVLLKVPSFMTTLGRLRHRASAWRRSCSPACSPTSPTRCSRAGRSSGSSASPT